MIPEELNRSKSLYCALGKLRKCREVPTLFPAHVGPASGEQLLSDHNGDGDVREKALFPPSAMMSLNDD